MVIDCGFSMRCIIRCDRDAVYLFSCLGGADVDNEKRLLLAPTLAVTEVLPPDSEAFFPLKRVKL